MTKYQPKTKKELKKLVENENIKLGEIDVSVNHPPAKASGLLASSIDN